MARYLQTMGFLVCIGFLVGVAGCDSQPSQSSKSDRSLEVRWSHDYKIAETAPSLQPQITTVNGRDAVITSVGGALTAFALDDGGVLWSTPLNPKQELDSRDLVIDGGSIFGTHYFYKAMSWNLRDGAERWSFKSTVDDNRKRFYPVGYMDAGERFVYGGADGGWMIAINRDTGTLGFERQYESLPRGLTYSDGNVYFGYGYVPEGGQGQAIGGIVKVDAETGEPAWTYTTERGGFYRMRPIVRNGRVYAGTQNGRDVEFVALDAETGEPLWRTRDVRTYAATWADGKIVVNDRLNLTALDPSNGTVEWVANMDAGHGEAAIAFLNGYLYHPHGVAMRVVDVHTGEIVHVEPPIDGTYVWEVGARAGTVVAQTSTKVVAYDPFEPEK